MITEKVCPECKVSLPFSDFNRDKTKHDECSTYCTLCNKKLQWNYRHSIAGWKVHVLCTARGRAKKKNIPFDITPDDIDVPEFCPILGIKLNINSGGGPRADSPSLDRINPILGYVVGNVQVISARANAMKNDASAEELRKFAAWINKEFPDELNLGGL